jgi:hypothetical protein
MNIDILSKIVLYEIKPSVEICYTRKKKRTCVPKRHFLIWRQKTMYNYVTKQYTEEVQNCQLHSIEDCVLLSRGFE